MKIFICVLISLISLVLPADDFGKKQTFAGVATPIITTTLKCGFNDAYRGIITYVARPGQIVQGPLYNDHGKIVKAGDLIIQMKTNYRERCVSEKQANLKSVEAKVAYTEAQYKRYKKMLASNSVSVADFQNYEYQYFSALSERKAAKSDLALAEVMLDACSVRAQFSAVVDKVMFPAGYCAGELEIVTISQLFPMGIKIKMDRKTASKITNDTPITIYPLNSKPIGIMHGLGYLIEDGIMLKIDNYPLPPPVKIDTPQGKIPVVEFSLVTPADRDVKSENKLCVPTASLHKDQQGFYVWLGKGQRNMQPWRGIKSIFPVKKVYVKPDDLELNIASHSCFRILKDPGILKPFDTVLTKAPEKLRDGDKVCLYRKRFLFMPGDPVKVEIGK